MIFPNKGMFFHRTCVQNGVRFTGSSHRLYSLFLDGLPKVPVGVSRFQKKTTRPSQNGDDSIETTSPKVPLNPSGKVNRFAAQYSNQKPQRKFQNASSLTNPGYRGHYKQKDQNSPNNNPELNSKGNKPVLNSYQQYNEMKQKLKDQQKLGNANKLTMQRTATIPKKTDSRKRNLEKEKERIKIKIPEFITVSNLATIMHVPLNKIIKSMEDLGFENVRHNYILEKDNAILIADEFNFEAIVLNANTVEDIFSEPVKPGKLKPRPPVVTIMGHVDHGKTTILDYLRKSSVVEQEFGGITQHIGAFTAITPESKKQITFLDTPGHAAFLKMRERGAIVTDIVILVVAADDSVMPQTIEAIKHIKKTGVPLIVAINKCDKHGVNIDKVVGDLASHDIDVEDYGGETQTVRVSGKTGLNMDKLEEAIITLSEMLELQTEPDGVANEGWIIESKVEKGVGYVATVLVRRGTVKNGDILVAGNTYCKVRGLRDENGNSIKKAGPSSPAQVFGWKELPEGGEFVIQAKDERRARKAVSHRIAREKAIKQREEVEQINEQRSEEVKELARRNKIAEMKMAGLDTSALEKLEDESQCIQCNYIIKSDVFGSAEAIKESINGIGNEEVKANVILCETGALTQSDLELAKTFNAQIFCFNLAVPKEISLAADREGVAIKEHNVIYHLIEDVTTELTSKLKPKIETKVLGEVEVADVFTISTKTKKISIAGCKVTNGTIKRTSNVRVFRNDEQIYEGTLTSLKYVKEDIAEARKGNECGLAFDKWDKFEAGDKIQVYEDIEHTRYL